MAFVYILESVGDSRYYIGSTLNLKERMRHHLGGFTHTTKRFGELKLALSQEYATIGEARAIERKLKKLKRKDYLKKIVSDGKIKILP